MLVSGISSVRPNPTDDPEFNSLFDILDTATKENNADKRLNLIIKACRIITAGFPIENRMVSYFQQQDFFFYLIALEEFHPTVIKKIMGIFIEKLPEFPGLISVFYHSILEIAICPETLSANPEHNKNLHQRVLEYNVHQPRTGLCKDIISKIPQIKLKGIDYWEAFITDRFQEIYTLFHRLDFLRLWIAFAINTKFEPIINRSCEVLEKMMSDKVGSLLVKDQELAKKVIDSHKKGAKYLKRLLYTRPAATLNFEKGSTSPSKISLKNSSPLLTGSNAILKDIAGSPDQITYIPPEDLNMSPDLRALEENQNRDYNCSLSDEFTEFENITATQDVAARQISLEADDLQILFDEWLLKNEKPLISQDPTVLDFFNHQENYQVFFSNIFNPMDQECSDAFHDFAGDVSQEFNLNKEKILGPVFNSIDLEGGALNIKGKLVSYPESSYIFLYRVYKYQQVLLDIDNWKRIKELKPNFVSDLFMRFHQSIRKKDPKANITMTLEIMDFFLTNEQDQSIVNIIYYNVPFILLWNLETSESRDILCKLVNLAENHYKLSLMNLIKLSRYYRYTDFFIDFVQLIYSADYAIDFRKCTISYKPPALHKIYQLNQNLMNHIQGHSKKSLQTIPSQKENQLDSKVLEADEQLYKLAEEKLGLKSDIDGIKPFINKIDSPVITEPQGEVIGPHDDNVAQPIPRLNLLKVFSSSFKQDTKENSIKIDNSKSFTERGGQPLHTEQAQKSSRVYPSMFETALKDDIPPAKEEPKYNKTTRKLQEVAGSPQKKSSRTSTPTPSFQRREGMPSINALGKSHHERMMSSHSRLLDNSRPGSSMMKTDYAGKDGFKRSRTPSLVRLLPGGPEGEYRHKRTETKETMNQSLYGANSINSLMSMTQTIMNIYAMPSKILGNTSKEPKFFGFRQNILTEDETEWLKDQEKDKAAIKSNEKRAYPLSICLQNFVQEFFERYQETKLMKAIGMKDMTHIKLIKALEGSTGVFFFSILFKNYLLKMVRSSEEFESSGLACGHIVNEFLKRIYNHPNLSHISALIHEESCKGVVYLSRLIAGSLKWKQTNKPKIYLQNYIVHETIGTNRLMLIRTLYYIILNDAPRNYTVVNKVTEHCWQALVFWFLDLKHQNMFQNLVLKIFEAAFKHGSEELLLLLLLKANLLSPLWVAYRDIFQNGFLMKKFHVDNFVSSLKKLVSYIHYMETQRTGLPKALNILVKLQSWNELKNEFIQKNPFLPVAKPKEDTALPPAVWVNQGEEVEEKPKVKKLFFGGVSLRNTVLDVTKSERFLPSSQGKRIVVKALNMTQRSSIQSEIEKKGEMKSSRIERSPQKRGVSAERESKDGNESRKEESMFNIKTIKTRSQSVIKLREPQPIVKTREGSMEKRAPIKKMMI